MKQVEEVPTLPQRPLTGHKGTFGTVGLLAGSESMLGAAILAARGALRGGAGLVQALLPRSLMPPFMVAVPAATTLPREDGIESLIERCGVVVAGPGLGTTASARLLLQQLVAEPRIALVLDADALNLLAPLPAAGGVGRALGAPTVATPHPGEAGRLLGVSSVEVQSDRLAAAEQLAHRLQAVVVLKGHATIVCDGDRYFENRTGNAGLATGGAGDVLAGLLGALLAQGLHAFDAACLAVDVHGRAGDMIASRLSQTGMCAEDLPLAIAELLRP